MLIRWLQLQIFTSHLTVSYWHTTYAFIKGKFTLEMVGALLKPLYKRTNMIGISVLNENFNCAKGLYSYHVIHSMINWWYMLSLHPLSSLFWAGLFLSLLTSLEIKVCITVLKKADLCRCPDACNCSDSNWTCILMLPQDLLGHYFLLDFLFCYWIQ